MTSVNTKLRYVPGETYEVKTSDITYLTNGDLGLVARIYQPQGQGPFPALLEVHGGAWNTQDHLYNQITQQYLAASGLLVMSIDFRTSAQASSPAAQEDQNYAMRWLKAHAAEYNGSPELVGIAGWSSGGHQ